MLQQLDRHDEAMRDFNRAQELDPHGFNIRDKIRGAQAAAKKAKRKNYYKILGVGESAGDD